MKVRTSLALSEELLEAIDRTAGPERDRSEFVEAALWRVLRGGRRDEQDARDIEIINRHAEELNREADDVLAYQVPL